MRFIEDEVDMACAQHFMSEQISAGKTADTTAIRTTGMEEDMMTDNGGIKDETTAPVQGTFLFAFLHGYLFGYLFGCQLKKVL